MKNIMVNDNFQEYDYSMESLLLSCNEPFHFCSKNTHVKFLLSNFKIRGTWTELFNCLSRVIFQDADSKTLIFFIRFHSVAVGTVNYL